VPFIGLPLTWWADRDLGPLVLWLTLITAGLYFAHRPPCESQHRRRRKAAPVPAALAAVVPLVLLVSAVVAVPIAKADAAFSASTATRGNTWTVSTALSTAIVLDPLPSVIRATAPVTATLNEASGRTFSVRIEYALAGTTGWQTLCTDATAPYACSWVTTGVASGAYDLRAVATSGSVVYTSVVVKNITVDNTAPTTVMQDPGSPLRGTVTAAATATDAHSGIAKVVIQYASTGSTTYKDACVITRTPYSCAFDTSAVATGTYTFRSVATDVAGNSTTSATVTNRLIDNTVTSVSMDDPGPYLAGTPTLSATAVATVGITSVRIQRAAAGTTTWTDICTDSATPFTCAWTTTALTDGFYDLRAVMLDKSGKTTTSSTIRTRIDNNPIRAYAAETANGGFIIGRLEMWDSLSLTYSERVTLGGILAGWSGSSVAVTVRLRDGALAGLTGNDDTITVLQNGNAVNLGSVNLKQNYIQGGATADFAATMTSSTTLVNGVLATRIDLTMGAQVSGTTPQTASSSSVMVWTPATQVTDLDGRPVSSAPVSETGVSDRQF
jgi:hypothetical protein